MYVLYKSIACIASGCTGSCCWCKMYLIVATHMYLLFGWNADSIKLSLVSTQPDGITLLVFTLKLFSISFTVSACTVVDCRLTDTVILSSKVLKSDL